MCEWMTSAAQSVASITGLREPAAKGAMVRGTSAAETSLESRGKFITLLVEPVLALKPQNTFQRPNDSFRASENGVGSEQHHSLVIIQVSVDLRMAGSFPNEETYSFQ
jgi:hypothetical protein